MYHSAKKNISEQMEYLEAKITDAKLFKMLPCVLSVKTRYADTASVMQATSEIRVEMCVTLAKRSRVGVRRLPYMRRELWWHTGSIIY